MKVSNITFLFQTFSRKLSFKQQLNNLTRRDGAARDEF